MGVGTGSTPNREDAPRSKKMKGRRGEGGREGQGVRELEGRTDTEMGKDLQIRDEKTKEHLHPRSGCLTQVKLAEIAK